MKEKIKRKLVELNNKFYEVTSKDFSETRNYFWKGWEKLALEGFLAGEKVLDLGCGNGRFADFLEERKKGLSYIGLDNSPHLLSIAREKSFQNRADFLNCNIMDPTEIESFLTGLEFDLVVAFGVMHHIPSTDLRKDFIKICSDLLSQKGYLILSFWDFANDPRFDSRDVDPETIGFLREDFQEGDHILDWRKGERAYRYCHSYSEDELSNLFASCNLEVVLSFYSDGRSNRLNRYFVLQ